MILIFRHSNAKDPLQITKLGHIASLAFSSQITY